jgi:signal transduction histidine kinase
VATSCDANRAVLKVADQGPGIPDEHRTRLFDSFFTTKTTGLGLGLSIACSIVRAHEGTIEAHNNAARGATFVVSLPLRRSATRGRDAASLREVSRLSDAGVTVPRPQLATSRERSP